MKQIIIAPVFDENGSAIRLGGPGAPVPLVSLATRVHEQKAARHWRAVYLRFATFRDFVIVNA